MRGGCCSVFPPRPSPYALSLVWWWGGADEPLNPDVGEHSLWPAGPLAVGACLAAAAVPVCATLAVRGVRRARSDVERILRLRRTGSRHPGVVTALPDPADWNDGGDVPIRFRDDHGEHVVDVRVNTTPGKIPVPGSRVIVYVGHNDLLVEVDLSLPLEYHPHYQTYETSSSMGGN